MRIAQHLKLLAVFAVGALALAACSDDGGSDNATADTTVSNDTNNTTNDTVGGDTTSTGDTNVSGDTNNACTPAVCGTRECGTFAGCPCGTCGGNEVCNAAGQCEAPGAPMGSYCGITSTCNGNSVDFPTCIDDQCASKNCLSTSAVALMFRNVCTKGCVFQPGSDANQDGVEDADAPLSECNPPDIVDGPVGNAFRCVNFADPTGTPQGICAPGTEFAACNSDADCPATEACEITTIQGGINWRCVERYREGDWGGTAKLTESCNEDPGEGPVSLCEGGLCFGLGCVSKCADDTHCDTTKILPNSGCDTASGTCMGKPSKSCTTDVDCSGWTCQGRQIFSNVPDEFDLCFPGDCDFDDDCGAGFYCRFFWNGETGDDAALDNLCLAQNTSADAADLGEPCDPNPNDNIPGDVCKNEDLCVGGFCSVLCEDDATCGTDGICTAVELPGDADDDGNLDFILPVTWCEFFPGATGSCLADADCAATESCQTYEQQQDDPDAPYVLKGQCVPVDADVFPGETGNWGASCLSGADCKSGFCLGATDTQPGFCTKTCSASSQCETVTVGGETANGICGALLLGWGGDLDDPAVNVDIGLCLLTLSSLEDCSSDFSCAAPEEACFANVLTVDPTVPATTEYVCQGLVEAGETPPAGALGSACDPTSEDFQCASGLCLNGTGGETDGYCSALCSSGGSECGGDASLECLPFVTQEYRGAYAGNSGSFNLCRKNDDCVPCAGSFNCPGDRSCVNLGGTGALADFRCVPSCETGGDCAGQTATSCNDGEDAFGNAVKGCFEVTTGPVNYCAQ